MSHPISSQRLLEPFGRWIDRDSRIDFRFEGQLYQGVAGDVLSSALWANGVRVLGRSFKYHRPRGVFSLANHDVNVLVENGGLTNCRGDLLPIIDGLDVRAVNTFGGVAKDRWQVTERFSRFLPVGFYYKAFHSRHLFPFYERQMRKVAGLGQICPDHDSKPTPKTHAFCDVLVVGGGVTGLTAAATAADLGLDVMLVDEQRELGGSAQWRGAMDDETHEQLTELIRTVTESPRVDVRLATQAGGWFADNWVPLFDDTCMTKVRARTGVLATGAIEQPAVFHNNDAPGVMLSTGAARLMHLFGVRPFRRCVVLTANRTGYQTALDLARADVDVAAVVDLRPDGEPSPLSDAVVGAGIGVRVGHFVEEALTDREGVTGCVVVPHKAGGSHTRIDCDGIVLAVGWTPNSGLLYQAGIRFNYSSAIEQLVPETGPDSVFSAGQVNGHYSLNDRVFDGRRAAREAAVWLGHSLDEPTVPPSTPAVAMSHPYPIFSHEGKKNFVDLDEDLHVADFHNAHQEGFDNVELLKRFTTVGMGPTQGKLSNMNAIRILAKCNGKSIDETGTTTSRPFYHPVPLGHLAGRRFHPQRRTPMHQWHEENHAEIVYAGGWLRPEFYKRDGTSRTDRILEEARNVRDGVGIVDVGTLGKIRICGPDAVAFLERIYTGRFAKQAVGRLRYGLACDELGTIIEDGVVARLDECDFYVTATSSGGGAFYRELQRWALIWNMDVVLSNVTGHIGAFNVAGPRSREVLEEMTDVDLSADAFPYLGVRRGRVADVAATLMRVGFVGELGYEIHVPARQALHVWTRLMAQGAAAGIAPFGVEAQRLLRLEKGHLIVGQDTDPMTYPHEAGVGWAIGKNKAFYVGARSHAILQKRLTRTLVGLTFPSQADVLPEECHLIVESGEIVGRITSVAHRSTVGCPLALAYVPPAMSEVGRTVSVRCDGGKTVSGTVAETPFYDSKNERQDQ